MKDNIIQLDSSTKKTISLKEASAILGLGYHATRKRVLFEGTIGYFDYGGKISVVEDDVREYKRNHFVSPKRK